ncbi:MAG: class I tRNA ligase family protein [Clostridium sp.]|nr:class I tRNA ligase family protein [Clostridium sp.]
MNVLIGNAWPYANGPLHLGRIAVLLPGDILARYHRMMGDDVIFLSGTDCHGTPVTTKAEEEGITPIEAVEKYHNEFKKCFKILGFSFDIFEKTHTDYHENKVKEFILDLYDKGYIYEKEVDKAFCEKCNCYLEDKNTESLYPICGEKHIVRKTKHLFFALSKFENDVKYTYIKQNGWRKNAQSIVKRYVDEGLRDRAVTRDFNWGVHVPIEGYEDKRIFVWIEAVMGYLTASIKYLEERNEDWREYWQGEDSRIYFVHGKDNIPFHTVIFPAILSGLGIKKPNLRIISSEYLKLEGKSFSTTKNWAIWADYIAKNYNIDSFRYYLTLNSPEEKDTDFTWRDYINVNNYDLVSTLGGFATKVISFVNKKYNGNIPNGNISNELKQEIFNLYFQVGDNIEEGYFKESLSLIMSFCKKYSKYFDTANVWELIDTNKSKCNEIIYDCIQIIANLSNLLEPFMPKTCEKIRKSLKIEEAVWRYIEKNNIKINEIDILFHKIDKRRAIEEVNILKEKRT